MKYTATSRDVRVDANSPAEALPVEKSGVLVGHVFSVPASVWGKAVRMHFDLRETRFASSSINPHSRRI
ncbi:Protein of unknown function [Pyronema omphalodes CBS 100304]|uniref:Uncharacterized protein n=1 Tax=Pyronema omphalodes (strain CBS 100304) TaxID=1076935 RepID=U4KTX8_PYROM|nr:Protein of unknown function [Pyronema omphalodes CBS 100304]